MVSKFKKNKKSKVKKTLFLFFLATLFIIFIGFFFYTNYTIQQRRNVLTARISDLKSEIEKLEDINKNLEEGILDIESEDYLEKVARDQLGMKKPGEEVIVIQTEENDDEWTEEKKTWWDKIKDLWQN